MTIHFALPRTLPLLNSLLRTHWSKRRRNTTTLAWEVRGALDGQLPTHPLLRARVVIERWSVGTPDRDGLVASCKPLLDVLQPASDRHPYGLGVIAGDDPAHLTLEVLGRRAATRAGQQTVVTITEVP